MRRSNMCYRRANDVLLIAGLVMCVTSCVLGGEAALVRVARKAIRVADDIPVRHLDEVVQMAGQRPMREAMEQGLDAELKRMGKITDAMDAGTRARIIAQESPALMARLASGADASLLRQLDQVDNATRLTALTLARGGDRVLDAVPDLARRAELLEQGGAPLMAAAGLQGADFMTDAMRLDALIQSGRLLPAPGIRQATLADFGAVMMKTPEASAKFWDTWVRPHWKWWVGGTALSLYLTNPDFFQTAAGELTEKGTQHIVEAGGEFIGRATDGFAQGAETTGRRIAESVVRNYFRGWKSLYAWLGTGVFAFLFSVLVWPRGRKWFWRRCAKIWYSPKMTDESLSSASYDPPTQRDNLKDY